MDALTNSTYAGQNALRAQSPDTVRVPEMVAEYTELLADIEYMEKMAHEFEQKFIGVLRPLVPQAECSATEPDRRIESPFAVELRGLRARTSALREWMRLVLNRCECG
jgi:hypothetical protein